MDPPATTKPTSTADGGPSTPTPDPDQKRRSSSRSIKRKRFDDEIVEYSLGLPPTQVHRLHSRARTQSQTFGAAALGSPTAAVASDAAVDDPNTAALSTPKSAAAQIASTATATSTTAISASSDVKPDLIVKTEHQQSSIDIGVASSAASPKVSVAISGAVGADSPINKKPLIVAASNNSSTLASTVKSSTIGAVMSLSQQARTPPASAAAPLAVASTAEKRRAPRGTQLNTSAPAASHSALHPTSTHAQSTAYQHPKSAAGGSGGHSTTAHHHQQPHVSVNAPLLLGAGPSAAKKSKKAQRIGLQQISTKDLGRWKPIDDLALILGVQQTNDLRMVHRGIKFSCKFTVQELQSRWYSLMYEETISRLAVAAMRNLHPELVEAVQAKALYTTQEEELLAGIKGTESPTIETFQDLLDRNALTFYSARTAKALHLHWQLMKQYNLLPDQQAELLSTASASPMGSAASLGHSTASSQADSGCGSSNSNGGGGIRSGNLLTFAEAEERMNDDELLAEPCDPTVELELTLADRCNKKEIRMLENELTRWTVLVDSLTGVGFMPEFDNQTLAVLRGRLVRYLMRSREISFGRTTKDQAVDVDLSLEGPAHKASRRQGTIKLRSNGDFFIVNEGKRPLFINGAPLVQGSKGRLSHNAIIEMAGLRFIFLINSDLINAIRQESAKMSGPLS